MYNVEKEDSGIVIVRVSRGLLSISHEILKIDRQKNVLFIPRHRLFSREYIKVKFDDIRNVRGTGISNTIDKGSYIGFGVKIETDDFDYLVDIHCANPGEARELIGIIKKNVM